MLGLFVIIGLAVFVAASVVLRRARGLGLPEGVARDMREMGMDVPRAGEPPTEDECPISLEPLRFPVTTACGHTFSASSIIDYWNASSAPAALTCPMCRAKVHELLENFRPAEWEGEGATREERERLLRTLNGYNRSFSERMTARETVAAAFATLRRVVTGPGTLLAAGNYLLRSRRLLVLLGAVLGALLYLFLPGDILPESSLGVIGMLDDVMVMAGALLVVGGIIRSAVSQRMREGGERPADGEGAGPAAPVPP